MKKLLTMTAVACVLATGAVAQTYGDELYEKGALSLTDIEKQLTHILLDNGVPIECLGKLNVSDTAQLKVIMDDTSKNVAGKKQAAKKVLEAKCGDL